MIIFKRRMRHILDSVLSDKFSELRLSCLKLEILNGIVEDLSLMDGLGQVSPELNSFESS